MDQLFFSFRYFAKDGDKINLSSACEVFGDADKFAASYMRDAVREFSCDGEKMEIILVEKMPDEIKIELGDIYVDHKENYAVRIREGKVYLYALTHSGLIYAVSTLIQLVRAEELTDDLFLFDYPDVDIRGYRVYTPGREYIPLFKAMVDKLLYYKYNSIIIEIGGAMEYKKYPNINEKWVEFCDEISAGPDVASRIQEHTYPWRKDSIHFDNGNGGFITQDEMRELIEYCREREFEVIPEVPSLSHSDYIIRAYPELNERAEDAYPDTYCPSNPKSYEILFDIIDEVVDVFNPKYLNIGHDEYYSAAKCERCRGKDPVDLYVGDIIKINDYLKTKNIKAIMWADKFFGGPNGNGEPEKDVPNLIGCRGKVPTDVILLNWAWPAPDHTEEYILNDLGYEMVYGNFDAISRPKYREDANLFKGGFVSNWGSLEEKYMQRNIQNFWLANTAYVFWNTDYTNADIPMLLERTRKELYGTYKKSLGNSTIELCHTTPLERPYKFFFDGRFIVDSDWLIGNHTVNYSDGTTAYLPVIYGYNIRGWEFESVEDFNTNCELKNMEVIGASYPFWKEGKVWYKTAYINPYPEKKIVSVTPAENILVMFEKEC